MLLSEVLPYPALKVLTSLPWHRDQAELLEYAESIGLIPDFNSLPSSKADNGHSRRRYLLASCWNMHRRHDITSVGAANGRAHHHPVAFSDHVLNGAMHIGESAEGLGGPSFVVFEAANVGKARIMVGPVGSG